MPTAALASWLLTFLLHSTLLGAAALVAARLMRRAEARAVVLRGALLGAVATATLVNVIGLGPSIGVATPDANRGRTIALRADGGAASTPARAPSRPAHTKPTRSDERLGAERDLDLPRVAATADAPARSLELALALALIAAVGFGVARFLRSALLARAQLERRQPLTLSAMHAIHGPRVAALLADLDAPLAVRVSVSHERDVPVALGRSELVLPERALHELDTDELRALLAHELAHLARRDPLWLGAARVVHAMTWFQPLQRMLLRRLEDESELATDALAVARTREPIALARTLERVAGWIVARPTPPLGVTMARRGATVLTRIERLVTLRDVPAPRPTGRVTCATLSAIALVACAAPAMTTEARIGLSGAEAFALLSPVIDMAEESGKPIWKLTLSDGTAIDFGGEPWRASAPILVLHLAHDPERPDCPPIQAFGQQLDDAGAAAELARRAKERCLTLHVRVASTPRALDRSIVNLQRALEHVDVATSHEFDSATGRLIDTLRVPASEDAPVRIVLYDCPDAEPYEQRFILRLDERGDLRGLPPGEVPLDFVSGVLRSARTGPLDPAAQGPQPEVIQDRVLIESESTTPFAAVLHWLAALGDKRLSAWKTELALAGTSDVDVVSVFSPFDIWASVEVRSWDGRVAALEPPPSELRVERDERGLLYRGRSPSAMFELRNLDGFVERVFRKGTRLTLDVRPPVTFGELLPLLRMANERETSLGFVKPTPKD